MKKSLLSTAALAVLTLSVFGAVKLKYTNKDPKSYTYKINIDGIFKSVTFNASSSATVTVTGTSKTATLRTPCGDVNVKDGANISIEKGCVKILQIK